MPGMGVYVWQSVEARKPTDLREIGNRSKPVTKVQSRSHALGVWRRHVIEPTVVRPSRPNLYGSQWVGMSRPGTLPAETFD